ncbi:MAG: hypothetical protein ABIZ04_27105 [Opitutus sp.]
MKITIKDAKVFEKPWSKNGRSGVIFTQEATAENSRFRQVCRLTVPSVTEGFPVGEYMCDMEDCVTVNQYGDFQMMRVLPLRVVKPAARAA